MLNRTVTVTKPSTDVPDAPTYSTDLMNLVNQYKDNGKILSITVNQPDPLTRVVITSFANQQDFLDFIADTTAVSFGQTVMDWMSSNPGTTMNTTFSIL